MRIWAKVLKEAKISGVHSHDLRHAGNTFASRSGATLRDLMNRMGHSTARAALIYPHTEEERDKMTAASVAGSPRRPYGRTKIRSDQARKIETSPEKNGSQVGKSSLTWLFWLGAGDGNRTRAVSLGITYYFAVLKWENGGAGQGGPSDCDSPWFPVSPRHFRHGSGTRSRP
ncbi:hypothetical protein [Streptosporangium roseum]|uniref:hypothetical protein n=1 Tax=Streptosporangium roseum TaxID=2001 RepID=UPI003331D03F